MTRAGIYRPRTGSIADLAHQVLGDGELSTSALAELIDTDHSLVTPSLMTAVQHGYLIKTKREASTTGAAATDDRKKPNSTAIP